jgi:hypothetical protein
MEFLNHLTVWSRKRTTFERQHRIHWGAWEDCGMKQTAGRCGHSPVQEGFRGPVFVLRIVIDQRNGAVLAGIVIVVKLVVFGIERRNARFSQIDMSIGTL